MATVVAAAPALNSDATTASIGQHHGVAGLVGGGHDLAGGVGEVGLGQRLADGDALRQQEGVGHAAADDQCVDLLDEVEEHVDLGRHLGAADDGDDRPLRVAERGLQRLQLLLHGAAGVGGEVVGEPGGGGVGAMGGGERVVHPHVAELGELGGEEGIVLLLALVEARVLQNQDVAILHRRDRLFGGGTDAVIGEGDRLAQHLADGGDHLLQRILRVGSVLRAAEVGEQDRLAAGVDDVEDRRGRRADARVVGDLAVSHRDVEVDADENALALHVDVVEGAEGGHAGALF